MELNYKFTKLTIDEAKYSAYPFETKDAQLAKLPKHIRFCKKCVMSNQRPRTDFNTDGICSACKYAERKFHGGIDWEARGKELEVLLEKHRSKDGNWDVVVPSSGGKASERTAAFITSIIASKKPQ